MDVLIMLDTPEGLRAVIKPHDKVCPHLSFDEQGLACCAVHDRPEYYGSPCWIYGNSDVDPDFIVKRGRPCLVGLSIRGRGGLHKVRPDLVKQGPLTEKLEDLGPWHGPQRVIGPWPPADAASDGTESEDAR
jgi:hypothetical protein